MSSSNSEPSICVLNNIEIVNVWVFPLYFLWAAVISPILACWSAVSICLSPSSSYVTKPSVAEIKATFCLKLAISWAVKASLPTPKPSVAFMWVDNTCANEPDKLVLASSAYLYAS